MKTLKLFLAFAFVAMATTVSAEQRVENQSPAPAVDFNNGWDRVFVSYNASSMKFDVKGVDNISFPGFSLGYMKGFSVSNKLPFYVEAGAALQFRSHKDEYSEDSSDWGYSQDGTFTFTEKMNFFSLNIPVNFIYKWKINDEFSLDPFIGVDFRINLTGKYKESLKYSGEDAETINDDEAYDESANMFSKDEMGGDPYKRFQAGWHIGVGANYKAFNLSISYGSDFNEIAEKTKFATTVISLGYNF